MATNEFATENTIAVIATIFADGWTPYPIRPGSLHPAVNMQHWERDLTLEKIQQHWRDYPEHLFGITR